MLLAEPTSTAFLLTVAGGLLAVSAVLSRASERAGVPVALIFLAVGMIAGSEGLGGLAFEDYALAFRLGTIALVLILFDGGLNTPISAVREAIRPAAVLASIGVVGTALLVAWGGHLLGLPLPLALLAGAIVSSTDASAVFSVLRVSGVHLKRRVGATLELESGINDPIAVILTIALTENLVRAGGVSPWEILGGMAREIVVGAVLGYVFGRLGRFTLGRVRLPVSGLYAVLILTVGLLAFGVTTLAHGSGFLAVFVAAVILGNGALPYRGSLLRVHDALAWIGQVGMFLVLGLLVFPSRLAEVWPIGLALALLLAVVARPLVVWLCLLPFRAYTWRDRVYTGWVGLRGAVPITLATFPVLAGAPGAERLFDIVFFIVVVNAVIPGATVAWLTKKLDLASGEPPPSPALLQVESVQQLDGRLLTFYVDEALAVAGIPIAELPFPEGSAVTMVVRGRHLIAPKGNTTLLPGDHVYVLARPEDEGFLALIFGRAEDE